MAWQPPADSVVHGSARRLDPARVSRGYALGLGLVTALLFLAAWQLSSARGAPAESRIETLQRDAERAPWVVGAFLIALCLAGTTKRCFGFGREGVVGLVVGFGSAVILSRWTASASLVAAGLGVVALVVSRTRWRRVAPWLAFALAASVAVALAGVGVAPTRWSEQAECAVALGVAAVGACGAAALGLWASRWDPSSNL